MFCELISLDCATWCHEMSDPRINDILGTSLRTFGPRTLSKALCSDLIEALVQRGLYITDAPTPV